MGRPPLYPTSIHLTLLPEQLAKLDAWRAANGEPARGAAVRELLDWAFGKMEEQKVVQRPTRVVRRGKK